MVGAATDRERHQPLEVWGGLECSVNRVGDKFSDQLVRSGHVDRLEDLDHFAALGLRTLRYPVLWERVAPDGVEHADWRWTDERLNRLRSLGIRPVVGLCHHGSGPRGTDLLDPQFPFLLSEFAAAVARRYPWIDAYTPINEPLTTARFAALYGLWYPHRRDEYAFVQALIHQCSAVSLAMQRIREVNPAAQLVQTEDLGKTFSTPELADQTEFENNRRWLTFDLLTGRVTDQHPLWDYLLRSTVHPEAILAFAAAPCPPDLLGLNYYVTGERFIDHRLERYPVHTHGGNGRRRYADIEAVRVLADGMAGPRALLREVSERYGGAIAITEAHIHCDEDEQVRWLWELWSAALELKQDNVNIVAVTAWSLLGAFDWHCLLTCQADHYEPGVFDVSGGTLRPTKLAQAVADLARGEQLGRVAQRSGWWQRSERLLYPPVAEVALGYQ